MKNSPSLCQLYVANALPPVHLQFLEVLIYRYIDDILVCAANTDLMQQALTATIKAVTDYGLEVVPEKIQQEVPCHYLGWKITETSIQPQHVSLSTSVKTLNDFQQLLGTLNWFRSLLGISTDELHPLFDLLKEDPNLTSPRQLTPEAIAALRIVEQKLNSQQGHRCFQNEPVTLVIIKGPRHPMG
ncbi:hypothetical protein BTVI_00934 [Pitangus sulphuratus]|nr:hypothetical protein BTVI_00934 [Pitangus sulphuratus]